MALKKKPRKRRSRAGRNPAYLTWIRRLSCIVPGHGRAKICRFKADPHHMTGGRGDQKRGKGQTVSDINTLPMCRMLHDEWHDHTGFFLGWSAEQRRVWQEVEIERLNAVWRERRSIQAEERRLARVMNARRRKIA